MTSDSKPQAGVPQGKVEGPHSLKSRIFPGTERNYWVYVPSQYKPDKPACLLVVQDGLGRAKAWRLPTVMDNLIHRGEMPVTIGIFVSPGVVPAPRPNAQPRFNRSFEYDGLGDRYARFLIDELLPEVKRHYKLSDDPNDRAIAGASSGGICAFNVAWERPDQFRRVFSSIVTFAGHVKPVDTKGLDFPNGVIRSSDGTQLYVADTRRSHVNIYQIRDDGRLQFKEPFGHLHLAPESDQSGADGMTVDRAGRVYVTTRLGLQICDQLGRVQLILTKPQRAWLSNVTFGGPNFDTLYVTCGDKVYRRRIKATGRSPADAPAKPPKPRL